MRAQQKADDLRRQLADTEAAIRNCRHTWAPPFRSSVTEEEPIYENRPQGSDFFNPVYVGSRTKEYPCWKRTCTICGKTEATTTTEPVITGYRPRF